MKGRTPDITPAYIRDVKVYGRVNVIKEINLDKTFGPNFTMEEMEKVLGRANDCNLKDMFLVLLQNQMVLHSKLKIILDEVKQLKTDLSVSSKGKSAK